MSLQILMPSEAASTDGAFKWLVDWPAIDCLSDGHDGLGCDSNARRWGMWTTARQEDAGG